ncbi:MAG: DUF1499 domain-containing protein [Pseudomonadota bacterium]|nr:DUF1499 domain-containing protein [Pseudomonadota bacterium]
MSRSVVTLPPQGHYLRGRVRFANLAARAAGFALLLMLVGIPVYRIGGITPQALIAVLLLAFALALGALVVSLAGLASAWFQAARGGGAALRAAILSTLALAPFLVLVLIGTSNPRANSAATEGLAAIDVSNAAPLRPASPADAFLRGPSGRLAMLGASANPSVLPSARYDAAPVEVAAAVEDALKALGWEVEEIVAGEPGQESGGGPLGVIHDSGAIPIPTPRAEIDSPNASAAAFSLPERNLYRVTAVARDFIFALPSDVAIRIAGNGDETFVDLRSVSRETGIDLGQNRRFIEAFLQQLNFEMAGEESLSLF